MSDSDDRERLRTARERAERHAADMDEAAKGVSKGGRYFVDPKTAGEIAEDLRDYGKIIGDMEKDLDKSAMKDAVALWKRDPVAFLEAVNLGPIEPWQQDMLRALTEPAKDTLEYSQAILRSCRPVHHDADDYVRRLWLSGPGDLPRWHADPSNGKDFGAVVERSGVDNLQGSDLMTAAEVMQRYGGGRIRIESKDEVRARIAFADEQS